jgi:hypothetical protein
MRSPLNVPNGLRCAAQPRLEKITAVLSSTSPLHLLGVALTGAMSENGVKLALTVGWVVLITAISLALRLAFLAAAPKVFGFWVR